MGFKGDNPVNNQKLVLNKKLYYFQPNSEDTKNID